MELDTSKFASQQGGGFITNDLNLDILKRLLSKFKEGIETKRKSITN
ncbi:MAG: hypothetical protein ACTHKF_09940 [Candidatus Nitrosocosmicus sp.]